MKTQLYLIRHGRQLSADAPDDQWLPEEQDALSEGGREQARRLGVYLAVKIKPEVLYASPILRAAETAQAVSAATGLAIRYDDRLREIYLNLPADVTTDQIMEVWLKTRRGVDRPAFAGGESFMDLQRRATEVITDLLAAHPGQRIAVVTHGGVIETLFFQFLGIPIERNLEAFIHIQHTGIFHWRRFTFQEHSGWELLAANDTRHMD